MLEIFQRNSNVNAAELTRTVSAETDVDEQSVRTVLTATFAFLAERIEQQDEVAVLGFGTFRLGREKASKKRRVFFTNFGSQGDVPRTRHVGSRRPDSEPSCEQALVPATQAAPAGRTILLHYHLFKNAGTSVDEMLRRNFGARWTVREFHVPPRANAAAVAEFVRRAHPQFDAISSHTALLPVPKVEGVVVFPIVFVRHPIDRLRSAYEFERRQDASTPGARLAKKCDFEGYVRELLRNKHHRQARNFQTFRLSHNGPHRSGSELERALRAIRELPFVGLVEAYEASMERLQRTLQPEFSTFRAEAMHRNTTRSQKEPLSERLASIEANIGKELYQELCASNRDDLTLHEYLSAAFAGSAAGA